jgi:hypothetical protein
MKHAQAFALLGSEFVLLLPRNQKYKLLKINILIKNITKMQFYESKNLLF